MRMAHVRQTRRQRERAFIAFLPWVRIAKCTGIRHSIYEEQMTPWFDTIVARMRC
jgi:hypothetical protein